MGVNKVIYGGRTLIDISSATVTADTLAEGVTAYNSAGELIRGTLAPLYAAIGVIYPKGSTLTCTKGTKTLTARTTSGQWVFAVPEEGTWTVKAEQGTKSNEQSFEIRSEGQFESTELSYGYLLFDGGSVVPWTGKKDSHGTTFTISDTLGINRAAKGSSAYTFAVVGTSSTIDVTEYSTLCFDVSSVSGDSVYIALSEYAVTASQACWSSKWIKSKKVSQSGVVTLDISTITGSYYVFMTTDENYTSVVSKCTATSVWLE